MKHSDIRDSLSNSRAVAAMRLGFFSQYYGSDFLGDSLVTLVNDLRPNPYVALQEMIRRIDRSYDAFEADKATTIRGLNCEWPQWKASQSDIKALCQLADQAIDPSSPLRIWYELGAALGNWEVNNGTQLRAEDFAKILEIVRRLPRLYVDQIRSLRSLLGPAQSRQSPTKQIRHGIKLSKLHDKRAFTVNCRNSIIVTFFDSITVDLKDVEIFEDHTSPAARNAWIYRRVCNGDLHKHITRDLRAHSEWGFIKTPQGILRAAQRYATKHTLAPPPSRKGGRPRSMKT